MTRKFTITNEASDDVLEVDYIKGGHFTEASLKPGDKIEVPGSPYTLHTLQFRFLSKVEIETRPKGEEE